MITFTRFIIFYLLFCSVYSINFHLKYVYLRNHKYLNLDKRNLIDFVINDDKFADPTDKDTILAMAYISSNTYHSYNDTDLADIPGWNNNDEFGWDDDNLRGYIYIDDSDKYIVIAYKGTDLSGDTAEMDKYMDNLMFSCCCGEYKSPVCNCLLDKNICDQCCLERTVGLNNSYFSIAYNIYKDLYSHNPDAIFSFTGHSLGGSIANLMSLQTNFTAITFLAPGTALYAKRLGFNSVYDGPNYNFGNNLDPIYQGKCNGMASTCYHGGYVLETKCHVGYKCEYKKRGVMNIRHHFINNMIKDITNNDVPECVLDVGCEDCTDWQFVPI